MKIYTKSGDTGETSLWGGSRVSKSHPRVRTYGTVDEANCCLGVAIAHLPAEGSETIARLTRVQNELFQVGSELATQAGAKNACPFVGLIEIELLEKEIDSMETVLPQLQNFILPGGSPAGSALHLSRTVIRRAERECVEFGSHEPIRPELVQYLNRLSDYLFVSARFVNFKMKCPETKWVHP